MLKNEKNLLPYLQLLFSETYLIVWVSEISDNDGYQVSWKGCWEVGPTLVQEHGNIRDLLHEFSPHCGLWPTTK